MDESTSQSAQRSTDAMPDRRTVSVTVNGTRCTAAVDVRKTLADFLREDAGFTGVHVGCEHGVCGACSVLMDGEVIRSCILFAVQADGHEIVTVEGLGSEEELSPLQQAFVDHHALQCGFCTPGMLLAAVDLLKHCPDPTEAQVREALSGNLCMCTGYAGIIRAVRAAAPLMSGAADSHARARGSSPPANGDDRTPAKG